MHSNKNISLITATTHNNEIQQKTFRYAVVVVVVFLKIGETLVTVHQYHARFMTYAKIIALLLWLFLCFTHGSLLSIYNVKYVNSVTYLSYIIRCSVLFVLFLVLRRRYRSVTFVTFVPYEYQLD